MAADPGLDQMNPAEIHTVPPLPHYLGGAARIAAALYCVGWPVLGFWGGLTGNFPAGSYPENFKQTLHEKILPDLARKFSIDPPAPA